jgi:hypothetical protein
MNEPREYLIWWLLCLLGAATVVGAKISRGLWGPDSVEPPVDPTEARHWARRRRWMIWSQIAALPAFATIAITAVEYWHLNPVAGILIAMGLGGLGFVMLVDALQWLFRRRLGLPDLGNPPRGEV